MSLLETAIVCGFSDTTPSTDVRIVIGDRVAYAHQIILSHASDFFAGSLGGNMKEAQVHTDKNGKTFKLVELKDRTKEEAKDFMLWLELVYSSNEAQIWRGPGRYLLRTDPGNYDRDFNNSSYITRAWCKQMGVSKNINSSSPGEILLELLDAAIVRLQRVMILSEFLQATNVQKRLFVLYQMVMCTPEHLLWTTTFESEVTIRSEKLFHLCVRTICTAAGKIQNEYDTLPGIQDFCSMDWFDKILLCLFDPTLVSCLAYDSATEFCMVSFALWNSLSIIKFKEETNPLWRQGNLLVTYRRRSRMTHVGDSSEAKLLQEGTGLGTGELSTTLASQDEEEDVFILKDVEDSDALRSDTPKAKRQKVI